MKKIIIVILNIIIAFVIAFGCGWYNRYFVSDNDWGTKLILFPIITISSVWGSVWVVLGINDVDMPPPNMPD